jgi:hypothetical protein
VQRSADAWQRVADEHVDHAVAAEGRAAQHPALGLVPDLADDRRVGSSGMRTQRLERHVGVLGCDERDQLALVGDVQRVDAQDLAGADDLGPPSTPIW